MPSPTPKKPKLTFPQALEKVMEGKKIKRPDWDIYGYLKGGEFLELMKDDGSHNWIVSRADMEATDWEVTNGK